MCYNKNNLLFQLVANNMYMFPKIILNQKTLKLYTSWVHWKNQCKLTTRKHAVIEQAWIQHSGPFLGTGLYSLKYVRKPDDSWCFQKTQKETSGKKRVISIVGRGFLTLLQYEEPPILPTLFLVASNLHFHCSFCCLVSLAEMLFLWSDIIHKNTNSTLRDQ